VVSQHCSVRSPVITTSVTPRLVSNCCRFVVVKALCEVLVSTGSWSAGASGGMIATSPDAGSNVLPVPGSLCRTQMTLSPAARAACTSGTR